MAESGIPMVNPGGESTMLGHWRIVLRQAEEAARAGRYEEAFALASRPDIADHNQAVQFRGRLGLDLIARANRRAAADDQAGAIDDLYLAERIGAPPDSLAAARLSLADRVADEIRADLDAGEPARVLRTNRGAGPAQDQRSGPAALSRDRRGLARGRGGGPPGRVRPRPRTSQSCRTAGRRRGGNRGPERGGWRPVATWKPSRRRPRPRSRPCTRLWPKRKWPQILAAAEAVLAVIPEHPAARQSRAKAWQQIAAIGPAGHGPVAAAAEPARAQAAALTGPERPEPERVRPAEERPGDGEARTRGDRQLAPSPRATEAEGIVWLTAGGERPTAPTGPGRLLPADPRSAGPAAGPGRGRRPERSLPALGRCRGRLPGLPGRSHRPGQGRAG